jgi:hypothetical protein
VDICLEGLQVAYPCRPVVGTAYLQGVSLHFLVVGRGTVASLAVGRRPYAEVGTAAYRQGPGAYRLAEGMGAFHWVALELSYCEYRMMSSNYQVTYDLLGP